jgi:hypothetical protein
MLWVRKERKKDIRGNIMTVEVTKRYLRVRVRSKRAFKPTMYRIQDVGRKGHTKRLAGVLKKTGKFATATWLFDINDIKKRDPKAIATLRKVARENRVKMQVNKELKKLM